LISMYRKNGRIGPTSFHWVKKDTFTKLTAYKSRNSVISQAKLPLVVNDPELTKILRDNLILHKQAF